MVVYASGQPFRGWRVPPSDVLHFLTAPWPRYVTLDDVLLNIVAYVPVGFLLALALRPHVRAQRAALLAIVIGISVSIALEYMQTLLPGRIASNVDVLTNALGTLVGALAAPWFAPSRQLGERVFIWRNRWLAPGMFTDTGVVLVALWALTALHPTAQLFGTGDWRSTFDLPVWILHQPQIALAGEAAVVFLNLLGVGLLIATLMRDTARPVRLVVVAVSAALFLKAVTAVGVRTPIPWTWLTPGVALGLALGAALLYPALRLQRRAAACAGAVAIALAVLAINVAPGNPYQTIPRQFITGAASHFLSFTGIVRALSELWPVLALLYLLAAALGAGRARESVRSGHRL